MKLLLLRVVKKPDFTIGKLYIDRTYYCDTLEDTDRGLDEEETTLAEIKRLKVHGKTAIPTGTYTIDMNTISPRFGQRAFYKSVCGGKLPRLTAVQGFSGVLIHCGNTAKDTEGCILVGVNSIAGKVTNSQATFRKVYAALKAAHDKGEVITLEIR